MNAQSDRAGGRAGQTEARWKQACRRLVPALSLAWLAAAFLAVAVPSASFAQTHTRAPATSSTAPVPRVDTAAMYHNYCSVCHGDKGDGKSRAAGALSTMPRDFTSAESKRDLTRERIAAVIAHGRPGTAMVGWKTQLSARDIDSLADHVYTRFVLAQPIMPSPAGSVGSPGAAAISGTRAHGGREADTASTSARVDMTVGLPNGLKGDVRRGGAFYLANCATCHGSRGDGDGPRAYFINPKPRNFIDERSRGMLNRVALYAAVSEGRLGTEMPAWRHVATPQQMADVAEYVLQSFVLGRPPSAAPRAADKGGERAGG